MHFTHARDGRNKWGIKIAAESSHFRQSGFECHGHLLARHVSGGKDEFANSVPLQCTLLEQVIADSFVRGKQYPSIASYQGQPGFVWRSPRKAIKLPLEENTKPGQRFKD